jgi:hypothetical protein
VRTLAGLEEKVKGSVRGCLRQGQGVPGKR